MAATALGLTEKQQQIRSTGVGASEVAAVVGLIPGAIDVWARKVDDQPAAESESSTLTEFGHRIEEVVADAWRDRHQAQGVRIYTPGTLRHPEHPWALASPDRVVAIPGQGRPARKDWLSLLEIKTVFFSGADFGEAGTDEVPERHLVQVAWQLAVTGLEEATLVALVNGDYREFPIRRDLELEGMLLDQVGRWWTDHVVAGVPPEIDGSEAYTRYLRRRYPADMAPPLDPSPELRELVQALKIAKARLAEAEEAEKEIGNRLRSAIGPAAGIAGLCTYKANRPSQKTDWEALVLDLGAPVPADLIVKHTQSKPGARVLRLSKKGE